jgi:hypothetical protein
MLDADDAATPEWVTYVFRTAHPILRSLPSKLAMWLAENMWEELAIPEKLYQKNRVLSLLFRNSTAFLPTIWCPTGMGASEDTTLQWESDDYRGRPKARCYPSDLDGHRFRGQNPQVCTIYHIAYCIITCAIYSTC